MNLFRPWSVVSACLVLAMGTSLHADQDNSLTDAFAKIAAQIQHKQICVAIYNGARRTELHLAALDGSGGGDGGNARQVGQPPMQQVDEHYKAWKDSSGHFHVALHRATTQNGVTSTSDRDLPVWENEPTADKRVELNDGSSAAAYFITKDSR
jgi:hypothetical protein